MDVAETTPDALFEQALALYSVGRLRDAFTECGRVVAADPDHARALHLGGVILLDSGQLETATRQLERCLVLDPSAAGAWLDFARALDQSGRAADALNARRQALRQAPGDPGVVTNVSAGFLLTGHVAFAIETATRACEMAPTFPGAWYNLALALQAARLFTEADTAITRAVTLLPDDPRVIGVAAQLEVQLGNLVGARARLEAAVARYPLNIPLTTELGYVASRLGDLDLAATAYESVLAIDPDNGAALSQLIFANKQRARWQHLPALQQRFATGVAAHEAWLTPFSFLSDPSSRAQQKLCAQTWAGAFMPAVAPAPAPVTPQTSIRLRIGYLSGDFYQHPTAVLLAGVLEHHDRMRFDVYAYSTGPDDGSALRKRIAGAVEHFFDAKALDDGALAARIRADQLDLLVDLKGYTEGAPLAVLAQRPAPLQVHWIGYPGTLAAPYIDYLLADHVVVPPAHADDYAEAIVRLPGSYQPNDRAREVGVTPSRALQGLPDGAVVFCAFNAAWKLNPGVLDAWATILQRTPGAVLWLLANHAHDPVIAQLRSEAAQRGIDPARLCFATRRAAPDYLALFRLADVFLDTWPYNAHTTASDALWMGVPVVTWLGETFAGRVAASLVSALGLPELVTQDVPGYIDLAVALATDAGRRTTLRAAIEAARYTAPLFDARATTRAVESAFRTMIEDRRAGKRVSFDVAAS